MHKIIYPISLIFIFFLPLPILSQSSKENTYDFLIIGGGTAGLVIARRLAEYPFSVLVLESGDEPQKSSEVPAYAVNYAFNSEVTFRYDSVPQEQASLRTNGIVNVFSGRSLSGTSNLNFLFYNRGHAKDYDNWGSLTNDTSWNYSNMLKYFKRMENYQGDYPSDQHGFKGPLTITRPKYAPGLKFWLQAGKSLGYKVADPNGPEKISFGPIEFTKKRGRRVNSLDAYITPIRSTNPNLQIATNTNATKIIFKNNRAIGVEFTSTSLVLQNIQPSRVFARNEIIVSAGAYGSPQLLLRSGIGPKASLREANITVVKDLPVGLNLQDHVFIFVPFIINNDALVMDWKRDLNQRNFRVYQSAGDGPFSSTFGIGGQAFLASSVAKSKGEPEWPDVQLVTQNSRDSYDFAMLGNESLAKGEAPMTCWVVVTRPTSRGSLRLNPEDPKGPPIIDVGYLTDPKDIQRMLDGIDELLRVFEKTPAYRKLGARLARDFTGLPECNTLEFRSREFWKCVIRYTASSNCHPVGTCRMGEKNKTDAVVDSKLRVIGIKGLRVADGCIQPRIVNANPQAAVYAIGEKASDMILEDWNYGFF